MINYINNINLNFPNKNNLLKIYIYFAYALLFFSIGENVVNVNFHNNSFEIISINYLRSISPYLIILINLIIYLKIGIKKIFKKNIIIIFFLFIILAQYLGLFLSNRPFLGLNHFLFGSLATFSIFALMLYMNDKRILENIFLLTILFFILIISIFIYQNPNISYGGGNVTFFGKEILFLNSNGFSRYLLFIYIVVFTKYVFCTNFLVFRYLIFLILISSLIFAYEGRVNIFSLIFINLFVFFYPKKLLQKFQIFILLLIIPLLASNIIKNVRDINISEIKIESLKKTINTKRFKKVDGSDVKVSELFVHMSKSYNDFSTGRTDKWKTIIQYEQKNIFYIFGNGPEFDRVILERKDLQKYGNDAANSILYLYLCGGFFSLLIVFIFGLYQIYLFHYALKRLGEKKDFYFSISLKIFIFIALRSFFENSYAYWGIDQILFALSAIYWNANLNTKFSKMT